METTTAPAEEMYLATVIFKSFTFSHPLSEGGSMTQGSRTQ